MFKLVFLAVWAVCFVKADNIFLTYPTLQDCKERTDTVLKVTTMSQLPSTGDECDKFLELCDEEDFGCVVSPACLYQAVPSLSSVFVRKEVGGNNCTETTHYEYYREGECIESKKYSCKNDKVYVETYVNTNCTGNVTKTTHDPDTCYDNKHKYTCPHDEPTTTTRPKSRTDGTTIAIAVVTGVSVVILVGVALYSAFRH